MSARGERSSAMARAHVSAAGTSLSSVSTLRIAAAQRSKTQSECFLCRTLLELTECDSGSFDP